MQPPTDQLTSAKGVTDSRAAWPVVCISALLGRRWLYHKIKTRRAIRDEDFVSASNHRMQ